MKANVSKTHSWLQAEQSLALACQQKQSPAPRKQAVRLKIVVRGQASSYRGWGLLLIEHVLGALFDLLLSQVFLAGGQKP